MSILLYGCTKWTLVKRIEKKLDRNYTRMLRAMLNKSWKQHFSKQQLYGYLPPTSKTIQIRWTRHVCHSWRGKGELISDVLLWTFSHGRASLGWPSVALWGQAAKADESVLARNQTKDSWTWNLAVSGSGKGTRTRVDYATQREARTSSRRQLVGGERSW